MNQDIQSAVRQALTIAGTAYAVRHGMPEHFAGPLAGSLADLAIGGAMVGLSYLWSLWTNRKARKK